MPTSAPPGTRNERRRAATRQALVHAARQILAEGGENGASIQHIAHRADVGFGSFYNHFESKSELFDAAVTDALEEIGRTFDDGLGDVEDPAELVSGGFRLAARMSDTHPEVMQVLRRRALGLAHSDLGLAPRARRDIEQGIATGRFDVADPVLAVSVLGGSLLSLIELRFSRPELDGDATAIGMAELVLRMLGLRPDDAAEVARRPVPPVARTPR
ncbi:TetR/AcrR family transcriptional regulator [Prauserella cavernicola]|uniref:TetR/AcrR family transcriptional regulator n=1 Tax=Prauserella cavernicola TaxID=2800127 RepID=A0A934V6H6_9PSEU|nr:TetR/AcrR family transcriptional regulator [Prauserella cavernicola]MBK1787542.1 TetR/AcrR family transcriptional regulator [Prauserella cavernicola]